MFDPFLNLRLRVKAMIRRRQLDRNLEEELSFHLSLREASYRASGAAPDEAFLLFALTALLLAGIGVYGTISHIVSGRTRDIGIRIALGAQRKTILHMVLSQGLALALAGAAVGLAGAAVGLVGALIVSHLMAGLLYGVSPSDPLTFISLTVVLVIVALAACYIPARRAMRVDPIVALREA
jgi:ABC-type antimicrobial peptide transport system permease subunit